MKAKYFNTNKLTLFLSSGDQSKYFFGTSGYISIIDNYQIRILRLTWNNENIFTRFDILNGRGYFTMYKCIVHKTIAMPAKRKCLSKDMISDFFL